MSKCLRCGRRIAAYIDEGGPYWAHVWPALHRAVTARHTKGDKV